MLDFRRRIALLLLCLGAAMLCVHFVDRERTTQTMIVAGIGLLVFYSGIILMLRRS